MNTSEHTNDTDPNRPRLAPLLRRAWYGLNQTFRRRIAESGITPDQFTILRWLGEHPDGLTQRALADLMASDPNTVTAILTRMQKSGLIERRPHTDDANEIREEVCKNTMPRESANRAVSDLDVPVAVGHANPVDEASTSAYDVETVEIQRDAIGGDDDPIGVRWCVEIACQAVAARREDGDGETREVPRRDGAGERLGLVDFYDTVYRERRSGKSE